MLWSWENSKLAWSVFFFANSVVSFWFESIMNSKTENPKNALCMSTIAHRLTKLRSKPSLSNSPFQNAASDLIWIIFDKIYWKAVFKDSHIIDAHFPYVNIFVEDFVAKSQRIWQVSFSVSWNVCYVKHIVNFHHLPLTFRWEVLTLSKESNIISIVILTIEPDIALPGVAHVGELCQWHTEIFKDLKYHGVSHGISQKLCSQYSVDDWMFLLWWEPHGAQVPVPALTIVSLDTASNPLTGLKKGNLEDMTFCMRIAKLSQILAHMMTNFEEHVSCHKPSCTTTNNKEPFLRTFKFTVWANQEFLRSQEHSQEVLRNSVIMVFSNFT